MSSHSVSSNVDCDTVLSAIIFKKCNAMKLVTMALEQAGIKFINEAGKDGEGEGWVGVKLRLTKD